MTLEPYTPERLEQLAMRFFDLSAEIRRMAQIARRNHLETVPLHDKKVLLWCENLELWVKKSRATIEIQQDDSGK